jgi:hypothetical protein
MNILWVLKTSNMIRLPPPVKGSTIQQIEPLPEHPSHQTNINEPQQESSSHGRIAQSQWNWDRSQPVSGSLWKNNGQASVKLEKALELLPSLDLEFCILVENGLELLPPFDPEHCTLVETGAGLLIGGQETQASVCVDDEPAQQREPQRHKLRF